MTYSTIQLRRGTAAAIEAANPVLADGEPAIETDTDRFKVGDGVKHWADLPYVTDLVGSKFLDMAGLDDGKVIAYDATSGKFKLVTPTVTVVDGGIIS